MTTAAKKSAVQALGDVFKSNAQRAIQFNYNQGCWIRVETKRRLKGVRSTLTRTCWPSYDYREAERLFPTSSSVRVKTGIKGGKRPQTAANRGRRRAQLVHQQLAMVAQRGFKSMQKHYSEKKNKPVHKFVRALCNAFEEQHWTLLASEMPVFNECFGSAIDLIALNEKTQCLVLIELKVGGDNYHRKSSGSLEGCLAETNFDNSPLNQAHAQLCAYRILFERCYSQYIEPHMIGASCVVFVGESGVAIYPMDFRKRAAFSKPLGAFLYESAEKV